MIFNFPDQRQRHAFLVIPPAITGCVVFLTGDPWVRDKISLWSRRHGVRTFLSDVSVNLMLAAIYMTRM